MNCRRAVNSTGSSASATRGFEVEVRSGVSGGLIRTKIRRESRLSHGSASDVAILEC
jgi:hypothetical protein